MKRHDAFPSNYLGKDDLNLTGGSVCATIKRVESEEVSGDGGKEPKRVAYFSEAGIKPLILNSGNWQIIEAITGQDDDDNWAGTRIEIYIDHSVMFAGKRVGGLRVREPSRNGSGPTRVESAEADRLKKAKADAWSDWLKLNPNADQKTNAAALAARVQEVFGRGINTLGSGEWIQFRVNNFQKPLAETAIAAFDGDVIPDSEVPF